MTKSQPSEEGKNLTASKLAYSYVENNSWTKLKDLIANKNYTLDLNFQHNGITALELSLEKGYAECAKLLIDNTSVSDIMYSLSGKDKNTALHIASEQGNEEMVGYLLEKGAIINAGNNNGETPLILAAKNGRMDVVDTLIDSLAQKSDISQPDSPLNYCDVTGRTAYMWASENGHKNVTSLLKERGARTDFAEMAQEKPASSVSAGDDGLTTVIVDGKSTKRNFSIP